MNELLNPTEAAQRLGISRKKIKQLFDSGKLPGVIIDETPARRTVRFLIEDLEEFIELNRTGSIRSNRTVPTIPESERIV